MRAFLWVLVTVLLVGGCAGSSGSSGVNGAARSGAAGAAALRGPAGGAAKTAAAANLTPAQAIVYTASVTVRAGDVTAAASRAKQIVTGAGGYIGGEDAETSSGSRPGTTITFKVPAARYAEVLDRLGSARIGRRTSLQQHAEDVTQEVADVDSRVASAKATLASFRALLAKATTVSEVIQVEQEISQRESDLESLQARQRTLARQTAYATVTLRVEGGGAPAKRRTHGFTGGLAAGWRAFTAFVGVLTLVLGWALPFLVVAAVIGLPVYGLRRRRRLSRPGAEPQGPA
ncbi:DUF4349 domain-containing protein [Actinoallomurus sp. NPDC052274]|uniref:DUF4349 domain-containing protein n=1 Tax=Actinoallomurus sp. NPDC052274 TaxID=3155420 RepID=UPI00342432C0